MSSGNKYYAEKSRAGWGVWMVVAILHIAVGEATLET